MRFGKTNAEIKLARQAKLRAMKPRHKWFAWYPVTDWVSNRTIWLEFVWRLYPISRINYYTEDLEYDSTPIRYWVMETAFNG